VREQRKVILFREIVQGSKAQINLGGEVKGRNAVARGKSV